MRVLRRRKTIREISGRTLPRQTLCSLLWAALGINRKRGPFGAPGRTAASASNSQEIEVYVTSAEGTYLYEARGHRLRRVLDRDLRPLAIGRGQSRRDTGAGAPVRLIYVADISRLVHTSGFQEPGLHDPEVQRSYYYVDTGLVAANVYLFAASTGLAAWFHNCDREALAATLALGKEQRVLFAQTIGYPSRARR
jgi:nitroreductase family protein